MFSEAERECWRCGEVTKVYTWPGNCGWATDEPPREGRPSTIVWSWSYGAGGPEHGYWANVCQHCQALQGDFYLYLDCDGPFFQWDGE